jgi:hypothetical protein
MNLARQDHYAMKVVKLNRRHAMGKLGFCHALRFGRKDLKAESITAALERMYGPPWNPWLRPNAEMIWGTYRTVRHDRNYYWIGVKNEADLTAALLMAANE